MVLDIMLMFSTNTLFFINEMNSVAVVDGTTLGTRGTTALYFFGLILVLISNDAVCGSHTTTQCVRLCF